MAKSPQMVAKKWSRNLQQSTDAMRDGISRVSENPAEKAAKAADRWVSGVQRSFADGKFQAGLSRVTLSDWKDSMLNKGISRVGPGAVAAEGKMESFMSEFLPHVEAGQRKLESMPRGDTETNIQRAVEMMRHNAGFRRRGR